MLLLVSKLVFGWPSMVLSFVGFSLRFRTSCAQYILNFGLCERPIGLLTNAEQSEHLRFQTLEDLHCFEVQVREQMRRFSSEQRAVRNARAYVAMYMRPGRLHPGACELCGDRERGPHWEDPRLSMASATMLSVSRSMSRTPGGR